MTVPIPEADALPSELIVDALATAEQEANASGITGSGSDAVRAGGVSRTRPKVGAFPRTSRFAEHNAGIAAQVRGSRSQTCSDFNAGGGSPSPAVFELAPRRSQPSHRRARSSLAGPSGDGSTNRAAQLGDVGIVVVEQLGGGHVHRRRTAVVGPIERRLTGLGGLRVADLALAVLPVPFGMASTASTVSSSSITITGELTGHLIFRRELDDLDRSGDLRLGCRALSRVGLLFIGGRLREQLRRRSRPRHRREHRRGRGRAEVVPAGPGACLPIASAGAPIDRLNSGTGASRRASGSVVSRCVLNRREHALALDRDVGLEPTRVGPEAFAQGLECAHFGAQALPQVFGPLARVALGVRDHLGDLRLGLAHLRCRMVVGLLARVPRVGVGLAAGGRGLAVGVGHRGRRLAFGLGHERRQPASRPRSPRRRRCAGRARACA